MTKMAIFRRLNIFVKIYNTSKFSTSNLFVPRDRATSLNAFLTPRLHVDFNKIDKSVQLRNLNINLPEIQTLWDFYNQIEREKNQLEEERKQIAEKLKNLNSNQKNDSRIEKDIDHLKMCGKFVREKLKVVKDKLCELEYNAVIKVLDLPNIVHPNTPIEDQVVFEYKIRPTYVQKFHLEIGHNLDLIEFYGPYFYYFKDDAAVLELALMDFCVDQFLKNNFISISNADFVRSIVVEGCGQNMADSVFTIFENDPDTTEEIENKLHLAGGSSIMSFMAFHTKNLIYSSLLPLRYVNTGRHYEATFPKFYGGLFNVHQSTNFDVFIATSDSEELYEKEFENTINLMKDVYNKLDYHFRIVYKSAKQLKKWESFRIDFEMYSTSLGTYIPVGYLAMSDAYYSHRLMFQYSHNKNKYYPKIISGTVINYAKLLGCILEQQDIINLKDVLSDHVNIYLKKL